MILLVMTSWTLWLCCVQRYQVLLLVTGSGASSNSGSSSDDSFGNEPLELVLEQVLVEILVLGFGSSVTGLFGSSCSNS